jgi:hypothetical protein
MTEGGSLIQSARSPDNPNSPYNLPPLLEASFIITRAVIVLTTILVIAISFLTRAFWWDIFIRGLTTAVVLGIIGWAFNWFLGKYFIQAAIAQLIEQAEKESSSNTDSVSTTNVQL